MADPIYDGIPTDGNVKVVLAPAIAVATAPTVAELTAGTAIDISCLLTADGWNMGVDESSISDSRLCDREDYERRGRVKYSLEITYVRAATLSEDKAFTTLVPGWTGFAVVRFGTDYLTPFAAAQKVTVIPVEAGKRRPVPAAPNEVFKRVQKLFVRGRVADDVSIAA